MSISFSERDFISKGIACNLRGDGRTRFESRPFTLTTGIVPQASGSCQVQRQTNVIVGIKPTLEENDSFFVCSVQCAPSVAIQHETWCTSISYFVTQLLNGPHSGIDLESLRIFPGMSWTIYIDVLILNFGGNLLDTVMLAVKSALFNTRIPKCTVESVGGKHELEIADEETEILSGCQHVPLSITFFKINDRFILDPTVIEESCSDSKITIAVNPKGNICSIFKEGDGGVDVSLLTEMVHISKKIVHHMFEQVNQQLELQENKAFSEEIRTI